MCFYLEGRAGMHTVYITAIVSFYLWSTNIFTFSVFPVSEVTDD